MNQCFFDTHKRIFKLDIGVSEKKAKESIAFAIDTTGSMGDDIAGVRAGAERILSTLLKQRTRFEKLILSRINDPGVLTVLIAYRECSVLLHSLFPRFTFTRI